jgi:hypothetical protein
LRTGLLSDFPDNREKYREKRIFRTALAHRKRQKPSIDAGFSSKHAKKYQGNIFDITGKAVPITGKISQFRPVLPTRIEYRNWPPARTDLHP